MRRTLPILLSLILSGAVAVAAQQGSEGAPPGAKFVGSWVGSWAGMGQSGGMELTLEKAKDGSIAGRLAVTGEPAYETAIDKLSFEGSKMTAQYTLPADENIIVVSETTFDGNTGKGAWTARDKSGNELAAGTWTLTRK